MTVVRPTRGAATTGVRTMCLALLLLACGVAGGSSGGMVGGGLSSCPASDLRLSQLRQTLCRSLVPPATPWCASPDSNITAKEDWPSQAIYFAQLVAFLEDTHASCLNTTLALQTLEWLNGPLADTTLLGSFGWTWAVFQAQYYDMPRKPGARIESPWTLGMKCWAFSLMQQKVDIAPLQVRVASLGPAAGEGITNVTALYRMAVPLTMQLCRDVMANCFVNATYSPAVRNGTCPLSVAAFAAGWTFQNVLWGDILTYPFS